MKPSQRLRADPSETFLQFLPGIVSHFYNMRLIDLGG